MTRYIDADKLSASITSAIELSEKIGSDTHSKQRMQYAIALQKVNKIIKEYPAADVKPVVHAHWTIKELHYPKHLVRLHTCSSCKGQSHRNYKFCPNCGAKMDGDEHDDN